MSAQNQKILWLPWSSTVLVDMAQFFMVCGFLAAFFWSFRLHMFCTAEGWCKGLNCSIAGCGKNLPSNCKNLSKSEKLEAFTFLFRKTIQNLYSCDSPADMSLSLAPHHITWPRNVQRFTGPPTTTSGRHGVVMQWKHLASPDGGGDGEVLV